MADFAFPLPKDTDSTRYFARPGVVLPFYDPPVQNHGGQVDASFPQKKTFGIDRNQPARVSNLPAAQPLIVPMFYDLFWKNRLHVIRSSYNAGNVLSPRQNTLEIYNAHTKLPTKSATNITISDANISIVSGETGVPFELGLQETFVYTYEIAADGTPTISATITWDFATGEALVHTITGTRSVVFNFEPQLPWREGFAWLTSVIKSVDGSEKRQALRQFPKEQIMASFLYADDLDNVKLENFLRNPVTAFRAQGVPVWVDKTYLTQPLSVGDLTAHVEDTTNRDFRALGEQGLIIIRTDFDTYEVVGVSSFTATTISLTDQMLQSFPVGTEVYPMRMTQLGTSPKQTAWDMNGREMQLLFDVRTSKDFGDDSAFDVYKSSPVFNDFLYHDGESYQRRWDYGVTRLGTGTSLGSTRTLRDFPDVESQLVLYWETRAEYDAIKKWIHARRGQQKSFWLPTQRWDFELESNESVTGSQMKVLPNNYADLHSGGFYVDIRVEYTDGSYDYREVLSVAVTSGVREVLTVDTDFSQVINNTNVYKISLMVKHRLASDQVEFYREDADHGFVGFHIREVVNG